MIFYCDAMLGKLATYLRILGLDVVYLRRPADLQSFREADREKQLFTRRRPGPPFGGIVYIHADSPGEQLTEALPTVGPHLDPKNVMTRCLRCNSLLEETDRASVEQSVPEYIFHTHGRFRRCPTCRRVYWPGSHAGHMKGLLDRAIAEGRR
jgi:uncharacterized protein with PIN domain